MRAANADMERDHEPLICGYAVRPSEVNRATCEEIIADAQRRAAVRLEALRAADRDKEDTDKESM